MRMGLLTRRPDVSPEAFRRHWREIHGPLAARLPGLRRYRQIHLLRRVALDGVADPGWPLDGISQLWFAAGADMRALASTPAYGAVAADEPRFMRPSRVVVAERQVLRTAPDGAASKVMLLLSRAQGVTEADFAAAWRAPDAMPGAIGLTLGLVVERILRADAMAMSADAVMELCFAAPPLHLALPPDVRAVTAAATAWHAEMVEIALTNEGTAP
jgi:uncharacterized protein (TIGR02118 family)